MRKIIVLLSLFMLSLVAFSQKSKKEKRNLKKQEQMATVQNMIDQKEFIFTPQSLTSKSGFTKQLTSVYNLKVKKDSCYADLPFWGESYMPVMNEEGGINFESTSLNYKSKKTKKGFEISFETKGKDDRYEVFLHISKSGYTTVTINSTRKSRISFYGIIED